jgi:hypothetical protein
MSAAVFARIQSPLLALLMVLLLSSWFAPGGEHIRTQQIDFWLVWLVCMLVLALPITLLETALARRSQTSPLQALSSLTREADARPTWRLVGWLAVACMGLIAGGLVHQAAILLGQTLTSADLAQPVVVLFPVLAVFALGFSWLPRTVLVLGAALAVVAIELSTFSLGAGTWALTDFSLQEWASAVVLALVASGLGMGLYWQSALSSSPKQRASVIALPVWGAQVVAGALFALAQGVRGELATTLYLLALLCGAAYLVHMVRVQLQARSLPLVLQAAALLVAFAVWWLPIGALGGWMAASVLGLLVCLVYAVFSGWTMKISHLRKALGFDNEVLYNLWRVAMRIVIPLSIVLALVGLLMHWLSVA